METTEHQLVKLSEIIESIFLKTEDTNIGTIVDNLEHHGMAIVLVLFAIPSALPIPAAGYSTLLCVPLMLIGVRFLTGSSSVWLPESIRKKKVRLDANSKLYSLGMKIVKRLELFSKPRMLFLVRSSSVKIAIGILICLLSLSMSLPIPGTNTLPAGGIFLIGFGLLEDDGLVMLFGFIYSFIALCLTTVIIAAILYYGNEGIQILKDYLYSLCS